MEAVTMGGGGGGGNGGVVGKAAENLTQALIAAQREMPAVKPDGVNPHFKSKFVTLGSLIAKVRPVLNKHGLGFAQFPSADENGPTLVTILMHTSGERIEYAAPLLLPKNDPQGQGSAITYMRRYALASALGISDQEDDDGHGAVQAEQTAEPDEATPDPQTIDTERVGEILNAIKLNRDAGMTFKQLALMMGGCDIDAPEKRSLQAVAERVWQLTPEQADALAKELAA